MKQTLAEMLKGHEGEEFYSPLFGGNVTLEEVSKFDEGITIMYGLSTLTLTSHGQFHVDGELVVFPSQECRDWDQWYEEQNKDTHGTWESLCKEEDSPTNEIGFVHELEYAMGAYSMQDSKAAKAAVATLKIQMLISYYYGGYPEDVRKYGYFKAKDVFIIKYSSYKTAPMVAYKASASTAVDALAFTSLEQAESFLAKESNRQLVKDYYLE